MYRYSRFILVLSIIFAYHFASAQIPNNGFETWETDPSGNLNPSDWETTNSDPDVSVEQYAPAKVGNWSVKVKTFDPGFMAIAGIAFTAFPLSQRPAFFTGWVKSSIMPGDAAYIIISLYKGDSIVASPDSCTFIIDTTIEDYTRFSYRLAYVSSQIPDSGNIMIIAGNLGGVSLGTEIIVDELTFEQGVGLDENTSGSSVIAGPAYPNPTSGRVFLPVTLNKSGSLEVEIFNLLGSRIKSVDFGFMDSGSQKLELSADGLPDGIYTYRLSGEGFQHSGKFTVNRNN